MVNSSPTPSSGTAWLQPPPPTPLAPSTVGGAAIAPELEPPVDVVGGVLAAAVEQISTVVQPEAAAVVATAFSFPLILMAAVVCFLIGQGRVDARDPKLRSAPRTPDDLVTSFQDEDAL
jgi:hypothetical protein